MQGVGDTIAQTPAVDLTEEQAETLAYMWNEEKLAKDVYLVLYQYWGEDAQLKPLYNISTGSEVQHQATVQQLLEKYDLDASQNDTVAKGYDAEALAAIPAGSYTNTKVQELYDALYNKGTASKQAALEVGCMVEVTDIEDLDKDLAVVEGIEDITKAFTFLRDGSYNHYWAFDQALKNMGVSDGCCSLGETYCKTAEEYPQSSGGGQGQGYGGGMGKGPKK
jgi:hypothetical protein